MPPPAVPQASAKSKRIRGKRALSNLSTVSGAPVVKRTRERIGSQQDRPCEGPKTDFPEPPPASEEEWQHRIGKRFKVVSAIKETPEYRGYATLRPVADRREGEPRTPTAEDRNLSKRRWEYEIQQWRAQLKQWAVDNNSTRADADLAIARRSASEEVEDAHIATSMQAAGIWPAPVATG